MTIAFLFRAALPPLALIAAPAMAQQVPSPAPAVDEAVQPSWTDSDIAALAQAVKMAKLEGLDPADYDADALERTANAAGPGRDALATRIAMKLAHDYYEGAGTPDSKRWHFDRGNPDYRDWLNKALADHRIGEALDDLLPRHPDYAKLRSALSKCTAAARCRTLKINMNRWRRLPRDLGTRYVWVNLPSYRVDLIENRAVEESHRAIIGKTATESPAFASTITGVTVNPWWNVPSSIAKDGLAARVRANPKGEAAKGYVGVETADGGFRVRQKPGPQNSLGRIKIEMPNDYAIYLHDTPARSLFDKDKRAFSHGCIRVQDPQKLAEALLPAIDRPSVAEALKSGETRTIDAHPPVRVYIVYLTAQPDPDAPDGVRVLDDVYGWDKAEA
ncbi:L,D-transpeptidase family protein [Stakelama sp. CBK3Z-3]|uniref:L,D-transpeptidase family protein n=1 Tax=Stakelama flava TaxID=2860338 RepID=A0ABS6XLL1_9SPHN|nr:L,D-transpeptidase family protein [Stakelama flava]MBW4331088.1 L,D-transpeptidase family protein [Stakelama flava]